jgi:hypothetical protein
MTKADPASCTGSASKRQRRREKQLLEAPAAGAAAVPGRAVLLAAAGAAAASSWCMLGCAAMATAAVRWQQGVSLVCVGWMHRQRCSRMREHRHTVLLVCGEER